MKRTAALSKPAVVAAMLTSVVLYTVTAHGALVAHWPGDDSGAEVIGARDATAVNGAAFGPGKIGQAFSLDGGNDYFQVADDPLWTFGSNDFTVALWVNFDSISPGPVTVAPNTLIAHDQGGGSIPKWAFSYNASGSLIFHVNGAGSTFVTSPSTFFPATGDWHHVAVTRTGTTFSFFADGLPLGASSGPATIPDAAAPLTIGQAEGLGFLDGLIDDVRIYDSALSAGDVEALAAAPIPAALWLFGSALGLVGWVRRKAP